MGYIIISIFLQVIQPILFIIAVILWSDWRNWRKYYPTILFMICLNFFSGILTYQHSLWQYERSFILPNHTLTDFLLSFVIFPASVLIFLSNYPVKGLYKIFYITAWVVMFSLTEYIAVFFKIGTYHNGWSFLWSVAFNCVMFPILRLHHSRPIWAWVLSLPVLVFITAYFNFSMGDMK